MFVKIRESLLRAVLIKHWVMFKIRLLLILLVGNFLVAAAQMEKYFNMGKKKAQKRSLKRQ